MQLSSGKLITRRLPGSDKDVGTTMFLVRWKHIVDIGLGCNMVSMSTKDLNQYITSVFAFNSTTLICRCKFASYIVMETELHDLED